MLDQVIEELEKNIEYFDYHNKNLTKEQDKKVFAIKCILEKLKNIHLYYEVARTEVIQAIENINEDEEYKEYKEKLDNITEDTINTIAWKVEDQEVWNDIFYSARDEVLKEIGVGIDE